MNDRNDWMRGYCCAIAMLINKNGEVTTDARELFREACGNSVAKSTLMKYGVDKEDIETFEHYDLI